VLISLESSNEDIRRLQRHFNVAYAFYGNEIKERSEAGLRKINSAIGTGMEAGKNSKAAIMEKIDNARSRKEYRRMNSLLKRNPMAVSKMHEEAFAKFTELISQNNKKSSSEAE
jgi:predicted GTPase